jgi:pimeloyl-[acyl-carrier protein] methyl ester esterase
MHGWAGQSSDWEPWRQVFEPLGWRWRSAERGYGTLPRAMPGWGEGRWRLLIAHSLGPHLLPTSVLAAADGVVLLASFARFLPAGPAGRRGRAAIEGMIAQLGDPPPPDPGSGEVAERREAATAQRAWEMLRTFMEEAAAPDPVALMPAGGVAQAPPGPASRWRLRRDLLLLRETSGLPEGFPRQARVLIVEAELDRIVAPEAKRALREALPHAEVIVMPAAGHALLQAPVQEVVLQWLARAMPTPP